MVTTRWSSLLLLIDSHDTRLLLLIRIYQKKGKNEPVPSSEVPEKICTLPSPAFNILCGLRCQLQLQVLPGSFESPDLLGRSVGCHVFFLNGI